MSAPGDDRKSIALLGLVSLLNDISSEIIQPLLPLFISSLGGGGLAIGLIGGLSDGLPSILKVAAGYWSDRIGRRKPIVIGGYALSAASKLLLPWASGWVQVLALKSMERTGKGIRSAPRDAMISEAVGRSARGRGFGLHRAMDSAGAVAGSILAYALWEQGLDFRSIFLIAGGFAVVALLPLMKVKERAATAGDKSPLRLSMLSPGLRGFLTIATVFALGNFSYMFFILRAGGLFRGEMAIALPLLLYILFNVVYMVFAYPVGALSDRIGRRWVLFLGYGLFSMTALGFAWVSSLAGLVLLFALYGLVYALVDGSERALVSDLSPAGFRSTSLGVYYGATGIAAVLSGVIAGALWSWAGPSAAFTFGAVASTVASMAMLRMAVINRASGV